jgi:hypothetical protein
MPTGDPGRRFDFDSEEFSYCAPATLPNAYRFLHEMGCKVTDNDGVAASSADPASRAALATPP